MIQADTHAITLRAPAATPRPIVNMIDGAAVADSRDIAAFFGRSHKNVLQALGNAQANCSTEFARLNFQPVLVEGRTRTVLSHYLLTKDGFAFAVLGFTGPEAARFKEAYIAEFNRMAEELRRPPAPMAIDVRDKAQLSVIALQLIQVNQEQAREISTLRVDLAESETRHELNRPRLEAYEAFLDDEGLCNLRSAARAIDAPAEAFFEWLKDRSWIVKEDGWLQPGFERRRDKHMVVRMRPADGKMRPQTYVTRGGLVYLRDRWQAKLIVDAREADRARIQRTLDL